MAIDRHGYLEKLPLHPQKLCWCPENSSWNCDYRNFFSLVKNIIFKIYLWPIERKFFLHKSILHTRGKWFSSSLRDIFFLDLRIKFKWLHLLYLPQQLQLTYSKNMWAAWLLGTGVRFRVKRPLTKHIPEKFPLPNMISGILSLNYVNVIYHHLLIWFTWKIPQR